MYGWMDGQIWENLEVTDRTRSVRKSFTAFVTFLMLIVSFVIIYIAQVSQCLSLKRVAQDQHR